jgi:hypothetical protein
MRYLMFTLVFAAVHAIAYTIAGAFALSVSKDIYASRKRKMDYLRDMEDTVESSHVKRYFFPAQILRGILMSIVLYPLLGFLGEMGYLPRALFLLGLMFVYTHVGSAAPCPDNIEGVVYLKRKYIDASMIARFQLEMVLYSLLFSLAGSWVLFL